MRRAPDAATVATIALALYLAAFPAAAQRDWSQVEVKSQQVAPGIHVLQGASGNENLGKAGALIVAHDNVRTRMAAGEVNELFGRTQPPAPKGALPVVTFSDAVTFHLNGEEIRAWRVPPAHTDGDAVVHFRKADVLHAGDLLFVGGYPVLDVPSGGSLSGWIAVLDGLMEQVGPGTRIIPGHGALATPADLRAFRDLLSTVRERVLPLVRAGKTLEETIAAKPLAGLDERFGNVFVRPETFLKAVHMSLSQESKETPADGREND